MSARVGTPLGMIPNINGSKTIQNIKNLVDKKIEV